MHPPLAPLPDTPTLFAALQPGCQQPPLWARHWGRFLTSEPSWGLHPFTHPSSPAGGIAHGPRGPTSYYYMLPMKVRVQGLKVALTVKLAQVTAPILPGATVCWDAACGGRGA